MTRKKLPGETGQVDTTPQPCNEEIIAALLSTKTRKAAAEKLNISERRLRERLRDDLDLKADYAAARLDILQGTLSAIQEHLLDAVQVVTDVMNDTNVNAATRLQAAQTMLNIAPKFAAHVQAGEDAAKPPTSGNKAILDLCRALESNTIHIPDSRRDNASNTRAVL